MLSSSELSEAATVGSLRRSRRWSTSGPWCGARCVQQFVRHAPLPLVATGCPMGSIGMTARRSIKSFCPPISGSDVLTIHQLQVLCSSPTRCRSGRGSTAHREPAGGVGFARRSGEGGGRRPRRPSGPGIELTPAAPSWSATPGTSWHCWARHSSALVRRPPIGSSRCDWAPPRARPPRPGAAAGPAARGGARARVHPGGCQPSPHLAAAGRAGGRPRSQHATADDGGVRVPGHPANEFVLVAKPGAVWAGRLSRRPGSSARRAPVPGGHG